MMNAGEPQPQFTYRGVTIYSFGDQYSTSPVAGEHVFDVRHISVPAGVSADQHEQIIQAALDATDQRIPLPPNTVLNPLSFTVPAEVHDDDYRTEVAFDAAPWLLEASAEAVIALAKADWRSSEATDRVALDLENKDYRLAGFFTCLHLMRDLGSTEVGICVSVDEDAAIAFLEERRPDIYWALQEQLGNAVQIRGTIRECVILTKSVTAYVSVEPRDDEPEDFDERAEAAIRAAAYERSILDDDHGWDSEAAEDEGPAIDWSHANIA